eukprot:comp6658_c0_seq1/m.2427 comp6658_c0_seq1/g.2427  ORF comp6658_c0_seq1/g.2427 comp6658_c0_seq1/m.2427 type:complete len:250 (-) comp6658_c0_seq1:30-779(-)
MPKFLNTLRGLRHTKSEPLSVLMKEVATHVKEDMEHQEHDQWVEERKHVVEEEEAERQRRLDEIKYEGNETSEMSRVYSHMREEEERKRRMIQVMEEGVAELHFHREAAMVAREMARRKSVQEEREREVAAWECDKIGCVLDEEHERHRRMSAPECTTKINAHMVASMIKADLLARKMEEEKAKEDSIADLIGCVIDEEDERKLRLAHENALMERHFYTQSRKETEIIKGDPMRWVIPAVDEGMSPLVP